MRTHAVAAALLTVAVSACATTLSEPAADARFATYVSPQGFSVPLPGAASIGGGEYAPVTAFEEPERNRVFVATTRYVDPTTPDADPLPTTIDLLRGNRASWVPHWRMELTEIDGDAALDRWVKEHYGPGCSVAERAPTAQPGVEDVLLAGDGLPPETTRCVLTFAYEIRYQPSEKRVLSWEMGQSPRFMAGPDEVLDLPMRDGVRMAD